jgi:hypothetical protein
MIISFKIVRKTNFIYSSYVSVTKDLNEYLIVSGAHVPTWCTLRYTSFSLIGKIGPLKMARQAKIYTG